MNSRIVSLRLASLALVAAMGSVTAYGCSSSSNNGSSSGSSSGGVADSSGGADVVLDTGGCTSDASTCNSCYTAAQAVADPLNACAPETVNCIPFTGTVPTHPTL
jgi:hypothetical protein